MVERKSLAAEIAAMRDGAYVPHPWLVYLDEPACGMWARGMDDCDLAAVCIGMHIRFSRRQTSDGDGAYFAFERPVEMLAADEQFMRGLMRCVRLSALHGHYRECGQTEKSYKF